MGDSIGYFLPSPDDASWFDPYRETVVGKPPGAGQPYVLTVPGGQQRRLKAFFATLTTSAVVANRQVSLTVKNADGVTLWIDIPNQVQSASSAGSIVGDPTNQPVGGAGPLTYYLNLPKFVFRADYQLILNALLLDAGDTFTNIATEWEVFPD